MPKRNLDDDSYTHPHSSYRQEQGISECFTFHSSTTVERLRMVCADEFTHRTYPNEHEIFQPGGSFLEPDSSTFFRSFLNKKNSHLYTT